MWPTGDQSFPSQIVSSPGLAWPLLQIQLSDRGKGERKVTNPRDKGPGTNSVGWAQSPRLSPPHRPGPKSGRLRPPWLVILSLAAGQGPRCSRSGLLCSARLCPCWPRVPSRPVANVTHSLVQPCTPSSKQTPSSALPCAPSSRKPPQPCSAPLFQTASPALRPLLLAASPALPRTPSSRQPPQHCPTPPPPGSLPSPALPCAPPPGSLLSPAHLVMPGALCLPRGPGPGGGLWHGHRSVKGAGGAH